MKLKTELRKSAKFHHMSCDGRFCSLEDHPEIKAIKTITELQQRIVELEQHNENLVQLRLSDRKILEAENQRLRELITKASATLRNDTYVNRVRHALQWLDEVGDEP